LQIFWASCSSTPSLTKDDTANDEKSLLRRAREMPIFEPGDGHGEGVGGARAGAGELYERATRRLRGFADEHKWTMTRLTKQDMRLSTVERLVEGIMAVLSLHDLTSREQGVLHEVRDELRDACPAATIALAAVKLRVANAIELAGAARDKLIASGVPPAALPAVQAARFVASAGQLVAAIRDHFAPRCPDDRPASWVRHMAALATAADDALRAEEAASVVDLACRWAAERMAEDAHHGTQTVIGPLVERPAPGQLAVAHLEGAIALDRLAYHPALVGDLAYGRAWLTRYPFALQVVVTRRLERVLGYLAALPMTRRALLEVLRRGDDARIPIEHVATCGAGERVYVYLPSVVVRSDCDRCEVKNQLRVSFVHGLRWLRARGVVIEALVAVGYSDHGRALLDAHGFTTATELDAGANTHSPLLGGERQLYALTRAAGRPRASLGALLYDEAFEGSGAHCTATNHRTVRVIAANDE
jgi:hypothetical protein